MLRQVGFKQHAKLQQYLEDRLFKWLKESHVVEDDIQALQQAGIRREIIGLSLIGISFASVWEKCQPTLGTKRARQRKQDVLLGSAALLTKFSKEWDGSDDRGSTDTGSGLLGIAKRLEMFGHGMKLRDHLREFADADSLLDVAKYVFVGAVERITGTCHDREVSALIAAMLQDSDYYREAPPLLEKAVVRPPGAKALNLSLRLAGGQLDSG